jgi:putative transposase
MEPRIREIAQARPRFGYVRIWIMLRREGWPDNKKRIHRLYRLEGLQVRMRARRKKRLSLRRGVAPPASGRDQAWSMDFVHDQLVTGRAFRVLTVIDQWSRESVSLEANFRLTGRCVGQALDQAAAQRRLPRAITVDNGTEFTSKALDHWAYWNGVELDFSRPAKPVDNTFIEAFNGTLRRECLSLHWFLGLEDLERTLEKWRDDYNHRRPHSSLADVPPAEFRTGVCCAPDHGQLDFSPA